jgi:hypothetical protein
LPVLKVHARPAIAASSAMRREVVNNASSFGQLHRALAAAAVVGFSAAAEAQITATILLPPTTNYFSYANCVWGTRQAGGFDDGYAHPVG